MENSLPPSWAECRFGDVARIQNGYAFPSKDFRKKGDVPLIKQSQLDGNKVTLKDCVYLDRKYLDDRKDFILEKGDILIGMSGSIGKLCIYDLDVPALQNQRTGKVVTRSSEAINNKLLWYYLSTIEQQLKEKGKGLGVSNVSATDIEELPFNLPPFDEQQRIVAKLDELMENIDRSRAKLERIPRILKRFRQSILMAAIGGNLTEDWRQRSPDIDSAELLLRKIQNARLKKYEVDKAKGLRPKMPRIEKAITPYDGIEKWVSVALEELFFVETGGTPSRKDPKNWVNGKIPWIKSGQVQNGNIYHAEEFITPKAVEESNVKLFPIDTILIAMYGEGKTRGQLGILKVEATTNQAIAAIVNPEIDPIIRKYFYLFGLSQYEKIREEAEGGAQPNLNLEKIKEWTISLPPIDEQREIVKRVERFFALADKIETRFRKAKSQLDMLPQSLLAKAFRGELVAQDPKDEAADELLKRIRSQNGQKIIVRSKKAATYKLKSDLRLAAEP